MKIDQISNQYYDASGNKDFYKGTSFRVFKWAEGMTYYNDERYVDWVMMNGGLCVCKQTHVSDQYNCPEGFYIKSNEKLSVYDHEIGLPVAMAENDYWEFFGGAYHAGLDVDNIDATQINFEYIDAPQTYGLRSSGASSKTIQVNISNDWGRTWKPAGTFTTGNNISAYKSDDDTLVLDIDGNETSVDVSKTQVRVQNGILQQSVDKGVTWDDKGKVTTKVTAGTVNVETVSSDQSANLQVDITDDNVMNMNIAIPAGAKGEKGDRGETGPQGAQGLQGANGEWTQTIYCLASSTPNNPTPDDWNDKSSEYQTNDRYLPLGNWSFDSLKPESREEYSYKCSRTKDTNGKWSRYTNPDRYAFYAIVNDFVDLHASFTAFAFCRVPNDIDLAALGVVPYGGINEPNGDFGPWPCDTYVESLEEPIKWHDTVPEGDGTIWFTTHVFSSDKIYTDVNCSDGSDVQWSIPIKAGDSLNIEFEFSKGDEEGKFVAPQPLQQYYEAHKINYEQYFHEENPTWYDEDGLFGGSAPDGDDNKSVSDAKWMAISTFKNGVWSEWKVVQIKGEDGSDGQLLNIVGKINESDVENLPCDSTKYKPGDAYQVYDENNTRILYHMVFTGDDYTESGSNDKCWYKLETSGEASHIHIKYAEIPWSSDIDLTPVPDDKYEEGVVYNPNLRNNEHWIGFTYDLGWTPGEPVGRYIGVYADNEENASLSPGKYKWSKFEGQDGWGYEYIYALSSKIWEDSNWDNTIRELMKNSEYKDDNYITSNVDGREICGLKWFDDPQQISVNNPYCYVSQRRKDPLNGWQAFTYPVLWSTINDLKRGYDIMTLYFATTNGSIPSNIGLYGKNTGYPSYICPTKTNHKSIINPDEFTSTELAALSKHQFDNGWQTIKPETHFVRNQSGEVTNYNIDDYYVWSTSIVYDPSNQSWGEWSEPELIKTPNSELNTPTIIIPITLYSNSFTKLSDAKNYLPNSYVLGVDDINDNLKWLTDSDYEAQVGDQPNYSIINEGNEGEDGYREQIGFNIHSSDYNWYFMRPKFVKGKIITKISANLILNSTNYIASEEIGEINYEIYSKQFTWIDIIDDTTDTDKLINIFDVVSESNVYLSQLMGVKNDVEQDAKVVAGIYGGGNEDINNNSGVSIGDNKLMMFAGADGIDNIGTAAFRVYDNGDTYVNNLYARGYISSQRKGMVTGVSNIPSTYSVYIDADIKTYDTNILTPQATIQINLPLMPYTYKISDAIRMLLVGNVTDILPYVGNKYFIYISGNSNLKWTYPNYDYENNSLDFKTIPTEFSTRRLMCVEYKIDLVDTDTYHIRPYFTLL